MADMKKNVKASSINAKPFMSLRKSAIYKNVNNFRALDLPISKYKTACIKLGNHHCDLLKIKKGEKKVHLIYMQ